MLLLTGLVGLFKQRLLGPPSLKGTFRSWAGRPIGPVGWKGKGPGPKPLEFIIIV